VWGDTPARVLALHGWRRSHRDFDGVVGASATSGPAPAVAVDLPGFGATPAPAEAWGSADYAALVASVVEADPALAPPVVVVGHSLGGRIGLVLAASRPDLVRGLVLSGAPVAPRPGPAARPAPAFRLVRSLHRMGLVGEATMERARQRHGSEDYRMAQGMMRQVLVRLVGERYDQWLAALRCPVELVWGDDDRAAPLAVAQAVVSAVPTARLTVCPGAGHLIPLTAADTLRQAVDRLLDA
jgi:pimeloyl-ACP methyl ester carboxylesterase